MEKIIRINSKEEMRDMEYKLKLKGYSKTHDCMWIKIYEKGDNVYSLSREY